MYCYKFIKIVIKCFLICKNIMNLLKPLVRISFITIFSRILGFIRDTLIAQTFGVSVMTDAFFIAFKLSNLLRRVFAEGAFYQIFLPILSACKYSSDKKRIQIFLSHTLGLLIMVLIIVIIIGLMSAPWIITITVPGFSSSLEKFFMTVLMFKIMFPYILFISLASLMVAVLNVWNFFLIPAFTPIFLNISMIGYIFFVNHFYFCPPIIGLAWSVIVGGILQCMYCFPFLKQINLLVFPKISFKDNKIRKMCQSMGFVLIAASSSQLSLIINTILASFLMDGSISWMFYADRIIELPIGVFGVTLTTILLPFLSRLIAQGSNTEYLNLMNWGLKLCCVLSFPGAVLLGVLSKPIVITLFQYGKFSEFDVLMTQYSVIAYSIGLPGLVLTKVLTAGFYARYDTKTPIQIIMITIIFTQLMNLVGINFLKHVTFAFSVSIGAWLHMALLYWKLKKKYSFQLPSGCLLFFYQLIIATLIMCIVLYVELFIITVDWSKGYFFDRLLRIVSILVTSISSYLMMLWFLGLRLKDFSFLNKDIN